ncbi:ABC transporter substrate-binding protein [Noviherbaspirillum cavernae]|uniref:ABC transporter substrate-binding protein n=1 Tax=Noviherbaspirillum cavernae TaxID=2320862 RepID=A0A418WVR2_9BURK|nr:ABC transporter substrate-binding protein [Noviherbaspirillum cavernae]RJF96776.1 ABC transporter substrate-binding protein [Noviherbaspirillum cavernae]
MKLTSIFAALASISFVSICHAQTAKPVSDDVVKIGVMTDMSGVYSSGAGRGSVVAVQMAVQDFGGKVLGKPIEVVSADHLNKADTGASKAREWFDIGKVDMVLNLANSAVAVAVQKLGAEKKRITISTGGGTVALTQQECSPYGISYAYDTYALATSAGNALVKEGAKNWFFLTADYTFGHTLEKDTRATVEKLGGKVVGSVKHPLNASDFSSFMMTAQAAKPDVLVFANAGGDFSNAVRAAREFGIVKNGKPIIAGMVVLIAEVKALGLNTAQGVNYTEPFYWDFDKETREWSQRFYKLQNAMPSFAHAADYSATIQYLKAIEAAGTDNPDAVMTKLRATKFKDFFLRNAYLREDGRMIRDMYLAEIKKPSESTSDWDLVKIKRVIPGEEAFMPLSQSVCPLVKK